MTVVDDDTIYRAVRNQEEQYSIWPLDKELPDGWDEIGVQGSREDCLAHIDRVWVDIRPKSRRIAAEAGNTGLDV